MVLMNLYSKHSRMIPQQPRHLIVPLNHMAQLVVHSGCARTVQLKLMCLQKHRICKSQKQIQSGSIHQQIRKHPSLLTGWLDTHQSRWLIHGGFARMLHQLSNIPILKIPLHRDCLRHRNRAFRILRMWWVAHSVLARVKPPHSHYRCPIQYNSLNRQHKHVLDDKFDLERTIFLRQESGNSTIII